MNGPAIRAEGDVVSACLAVDSAHARTSIPHKLGDDIAEVLVVVREVEF